jgi:hypothetical protein
MIKSDDIELLRLASKRIHFQHLYDTVLLDALEEKLLERYQENNNSREFEDGIAWMSKALAGSRIEQYKKTIEVVAKNVENEYLKEKISGYLKYFK